MAVLETAAKCAEATMIEWMSTQPNIFVLEVGQHDVSAFECRYPEAVDGGTDLVLGEVCDRHPRSIYWCLETGSLWCDGGPPDWDWHTVFISTEASRTQKPS